MKEFISRKEADTLRWAKKFIEKFPTDSVICLDGDMGAGKTAIVRGFAGALGIMEPIVSPTFTIINEYPGEIPLYHFDLYRISNIDELYHLGFEEYLVKNGIKVFEWASKFDVFDNSAYRISIEIIDYHTRKITYSEGNPIQ